MKMDYDQYKNRGEMLAAKREEIEHSLHHPNKYGEFTCDVLLLCKFLNTLISLTKDDKIRWTMDELCIFRPVKRPLLDSVKITASMMKPEVFRLSVNHNGAWLHKTFVNGDNGFSEMKCLLAAVNANIARTDSFIKNLTEELSRL